MKKIFTLLVGVWLTFFSFSVFAGGEGPIHFPVKENSNTKAHKHNEEGIGEWEKGNFEAALIHFQKAAKADGSLGEIYFNEALCFAKLGKHAAAAINFKAARANAQGNIKILKSAILNEHAPMGEGS